MNQQFLIEKIVYCRVFASVRWLEKFNLCLLKKILENFSFQQHSMAADWRAVKLWTNNYFNEALKNFSMLCRESLSCRAASS